MLFCKLIMRSLKKLEPYFLPVILLLIVIMVAGALGRFDVNEWDEARNGINAYEMLHNHDYINLYYGGKPDTWNAKPSLLSWLIILCYKLVGYNEWGLRLPAFLFTLGFFIYYYKLVTLLRDKLTAFFCCLILISCKGILGMHVGLTGDFDALLICFLTAAAYYFIQYIDYNKHYGILLTGLFTGLAFYAKGPAAFLFVPGFVLYITYRGKWKQLLSEKLTWLAALSIIVIAGSWIMLQVKYGVTTESKDTTYGSKNSLEILFFHDIVNRFTNPDFDHGKYTRDYQFVIRTLDIMLNVWNYFFYLATLTGIILLFKHRSKLASYLKQDYVKPVIFCVCMALPIFLFLTISMNQHDWYMAPAWGFVVFIIVRGLQYLSGKRKEVACVAIACWVFLAIRHTMYLNRLPSSIHQTFAEHRETFSTADSVIYLGPPYQHIFLYTKWQDKPMLRIDELQAAYNHPGQLFLVRKEELQKPEAQGIQSLFDIGPDYCMARIK